MRRALLLVVLAALLAAPVARTNGDPASDILLTNPVYFPIDATLSDSDRAKLLQTVADAKQRGYPIRVALIPFTSDLGTAVSLWRHPQDYAKFLGSELAFVYKNRLLVVQPSGFGFYDRGKPVAKEHGADHVLKKFSKRERTEIDVVIEEAADAVELIVSEGVDAAMNRVNTR